MLRTNAITVDRISKAYRVGPKHCVADTLVGTLQSLARSPLRNYRYIRGLNRVRPDTEQLADASATFWCFKM